MAEHSVSDVMGLLREVYQQKDGPQRLLEFLTQAGLEAEVAEHVGAEKYARDEVRRGHRNGYKARGLQTRVGRWSCGFRRFAAVSRTVRACGVGGSGMNGRCWWPARRCITRG